MSKKHFTVVFEIEYAEDFSAAAKVFTEHMCNESLYHGARVTGAGWEDSMTRADLLVAHCEDEGIDVPGHLQ